LPRPKDGTLVPHPGLAQGTHHPRDRGRWRRVNRL
jgi:hypothetical protein